MKRYRSIFKEAKDVNGVNLKVGDLVDLPGWDDRHGSWSDWENAGMGKILKISGSKITIKYMDDPKAGINTIDTDSHSVEKR